ncbi:HutP family protein [Pelosinus sp. IPA-1]|uniref:HutP family protein n=1 Tax=Pelosinus sp. IPA-1 TaxID=3029569 RepID=UPI00243616DE|nr:HutP family protein [Pelosinus sp. IPA-1]GMB01586.1 HutP family protein [Pelosinus sp. IPA-1]
MEITSIVVGRAAMNMAISEDRQDEKEIQKRLNARDIRSVAVDFGGEYLGSVKKIIERAVVAAERQGLVSANHVGEGAVAGATHAALEQITSKAVGLNVGGKIGIARHGEHICVAVYFGVGVLNLNEVAVGLAHRSLASVEE